MSIATDIVRTYRAPREVQRKRISGAAREDRALAILMAACVLIFVAQWPRLARQAHFDEAVDLDALMAGALFGWIFVAPLFFYTLSLLVHWALRLAGSQSTAYASRIVLFWALLASTPLWLLSGLVSGFIGDGPSLTLVGLLAFAAVIVFWVAGITVISGLSNEEAA